jgi:SAM-dependent methyltransferase
MLRAHLDPKTDAASYRPEKIEAICSFLAREFALVSGSRVVDLGCGPGLYAANLARRGIHVTGVDQSENSIAYARQYASQNSLDIEYVIADYRSELVAEPCDAAIMVSQDYGVLSKPDRHKLLKNVCRLVRAGGFFALDIPSMVAWDELQEGTRWYTADSGFWRPHPHVVLERQLKYPEIAASCRLVVVCDEEVTAYRINQTYFSPESIAQELNEAGLAVHAIYSDLMGNELDGASRVLGLVCRRTRHEEVM